MPYVQTSCPMHVGKPPIHTPQRPTVATAPHVVGSPSKLVPSGCWKFLNGQNTSKRWSHGCSAVTINVQSCRWEPILTWKFQKILWPSTILIYSFFPAGGSWSLHGVLSTSMGLISILNGHGYRLSYLLPGWVQSSRNEKFNVSIFLGSGHLHCSRSDQKPRP